MKKHPNKNVRTRRYTLLLAPQEFEMAKRIAESEFRTLPDFFRMHIYDRATILGFSTNETTRANIHVRASA